MPLESGRTRIKAALLSLYNRMNVPAVTFLWGLCVRVAGGNEVGPGEGPGTPGNNGGFGGRCWVLLGLNGWVTRMVQLMSRDAEAPGSISGASQSPQDGTSRDRGAGVVAVLSLGGTPVLAGSPGLAGEMLWCVTVNFTGSHLPLGRPLAALLALGVQRTWVLSC